jgi:enoyl-CoA hydratase/carnithine racemase
VLDAAEAQRIGLVDKVLPRASFDADWRAIATSLATRPAGEIKRVMKGVSTTEAVAAFARLWVADEHWAAADKMMKRGK